MADKPSNPYAEDGRCHNSELAWYGQECGRPAAWIGTKPSGWRSGFCDRCKEGGREARAMTIWEKITP